MTQVPFEIPLVPAKSQKFYVALSGVTYAMKFRWCPPAQCWMIDLADANDVPLVMGIAVITGIDLLSQYEYLGIPGQLIIQSDYDTDAVPTFADLGVLGRAYYVLVS